MHSINFNKLLQRYAGSGDMATVRETQDLERLSRLDFHTYILARKQIFEDRNPPKKEDPWQ